jgi:hypothetical protein
MQVLKIVRTYQKKKKKKINLGTCEGGAAATWLCW